MTNLHTCVLRKIWQKYNYMLNISKSLLTSLRAYNEKSEKSIPLTFCFVHPDSVEPVFRFYILPFTKAGNSFAKTNIARVQAWVLSAMITIGGSNVRFYQADYSEDWSNTVKSVMFDLTARNCPS